MSKMILTVDDSRAMREMLKVALTGAGFEVIQAVDGEHGLEVADEQVEMQQLPDAIITDINMPKLDGFGFIEAIRADDRYRGIPILVLTTEGSAEKKSRARNAGATGWIMKPFDQTKLVTALRRVVG